MTQLPIPVTSGRATRVWDDIEARQRGSERTHTLAAEETSPGGRRAGLDWVPWLEPRWVRFDTADCAAALQPSTFAGQDDDEFTASAGAESRDEIALVISPIGDQTTSAATCSPARRLRLPGELTQHQQQAAREGREGRAATSLDGVDSQLALRMLSCNPPPLWRGLRSRGDRGPRADRAARQGLWCPSSRLTWASRWCGVGSPDGAERRYVVRPRRRGRCCCMAAGAGAAELCQTRCVGQAPAGTDQALMTAVSARAQRLTELEWSTPLAVGAGA